MTGDGLSALVDRLRWDRRRDPYRGLRGYSQTAREVAHVADQLVTAGLPRLPGRPATTTQTTADVPQDT